MKVAVFNWFLHTMGGGERYSCMIAQVLSQDDHDVDLIAYRGVDRDVLADYLGLNLSKVNLRIIPDRGDEALAKISEEYDLFVNGSYMSRVKPRAKRNIYLCYFPTPFDHDVERWKRWAFRIAGPMVGSALPYSLGDGWYEREGGRRRPWMWTNGDAVVRLAPGRNRVLEFMVGRPSAPSGVELVVLDSEDRDVANFSVSRDAFVTHRFDAGSSETSTELRLHSDVFVPKGDARTLGVAVVGLRPAGRLGVRVRMLLAFPALARSPRDFSFLDSYDKVFAVSEYTRTWVQRYWGIRSGVLYPPIRVDLVPPRQKENRIVVVGRFFSPKYGHSKRQLELVRAFKHMISRGGLDGWRLDIVGGCEKIQEDYLHEVQRAAEGLPVSIHANASRAVLEEMLSTASIFWTATGYGESENRRPWALEHFGMTTVESMAAGCVPVVIDKAGQREIVRDGVDGYRWSTLPQLEARTREVMTDDTLRARMADAAIERAKVFSEDAFAARWHALTSEG